MKRLLALCTIGLGVVLAQNTIFSDNMDNFPSGWVLEPVRGTVNWTRMTDRYNTPSASAKCCNSSSYPNSLANRMTKYFSLSGYGVAKLRFWRWLGLETAGWDTIRLEFHSATGWYTVWQTTAVLEQWRQDSFDVPATVDGIRFHFGCNDQQTGFGVYVDDVELTAYLTDVGVTRIITPTGRVDSGVGVVPRCSTYNYSACPVSYWVMCRIGTSYRDSIFVSGHLPGTFREVAFPLWPNPGPRGTLPVRCSTMLAYDFQRANDHADTTCRVAVRDVGCAAVTGPPNAVDSGYAVTPQALLFNAGTEPETTFAWMRIGSFYSDTRQQAIAPGETVLVNFASRVLTGPRGTHTARCTTMTTNDCAPGNDLKTRQIDVRVHDVGAVALLSPGGVVDSGTLVDPRARVQNFGTYTENFNCIYRIGTYCDTQQVFALAPGATRDVSFASFVAIPGNYTRTCSTMLSTDLPAANDAVSASLLVRYLDLGIPRILAPHTRILPGSIAPRVEVRNYGNVPITNCPVVLRIDPGYQQTVNTSLAPGQTDTLVYPIWNATFGTYRATARHSLSGDMNIRNDSVVKTVVVGAAYHDVGASGLRRPDSITNPGSISPMVSIFNYGSVPDSNVPVRLSIEDAGGNVVFSANDTFRGPIEPGEELNVTFRSYWLASTGSYTVRAWTLLGSDEQRANDTMRQRVLVALHSVCPMAVLTPSGSVGASHPLRPRIRVRNRGSVADSFPVHLLVERFATPVYRDSARCKLAPGETAVVTLPTWTPVAIGDHQCMAWTLLPGDARTDDDTIWSTFVVSDPVIDAAADAILAPAGLTPPGPLRPQARVRNAGNIQASFWAFLVFFRQGLPVYAESSWVDLLGQNETRVITLPVWQAGAGDYRAVFSVRCAGDVNTGNDTNRVLFAVRAPGRWIERSSVPVLPGGREVGKGGALTAVPTALYALKGNKTSDFFRYPTGDSTWLTSASIPDGREAKKVGDGGALTNDGSNFIYALKGNGTSGFWCYDTRGDSWSQKADVPKAPSNKKVKGGSGLAYVEKSGVGSVYCLKGGKTDFYRYRIDSDTWYTLASAPSGERAKWDKGSWLVWDGERKLYAHKAKYHELWVYDIDADTWEPAPLPGMPMVGLSGRKKSKDGGCAAWGGGVVYALKGGNTQECWAFIPSLTTWTEFDTIPSVGSSLKRKKPKAGAGVAYLDGVVWALKGNKTREFWCYTADSSLMFAQARVQGIQSSASSTLQTEPNGSWVCCASPVVRSSRISLKYSYPGPGHSLLTLYDAVGRVASSLALAPGRARSTELSTQQLKPGVYFVRLSGEHGTAVQKLVIE